MKKIQRIALIGGTHGNELSGIYLVKKWLTQQTLKQWNSLDITARIVNPRACEQSVRYIETDLNREFGVADLADMTKSGYEALLAKKINIEFGPKGNSPYELLIDLHNTTSNMGACLMLQRKNAFTILLGGYVKHHMPHANIYFQDNVPEEKQNFLLTVAQQGVTVEVGPQPNSVLQQETLDLMEEMTRHILDFVELCNNDSSLEIPDEYDAFQYSENLHLPVDDKGQRKGLVSCLIDQKDFQAIEPGQVVMETFSGEKITWQGDYTAYPLFVNEAAYHKSHSAMTLSRKIVMSCRDYK
ncbi:aspartoacylase [Marinomonas rhizomae]|uniref:Aspartoacylase n=1 Tax=Marinomonas rhizomae TaxID=491948 RepID=A0A366J9I4_9GAMM|nr:aspartoacylase [Marinomonas rhizomae]RBP82528.1 aspartoacylase [Marinomonas rhizomae]RNF73686.1 aspartoacylase [Marinomonas rhizomae]